MQPWEHHFDPLSETHRYLCSWLSCLAESELLAELQTQFEDTKAIDQEITEKQATLREIEKDIQNLLDLAETFGAGAAVERLKQREVEKADILTSLRQLEGKREMARVEVTPDALMLALGVWRDQLREKAKSGNIPETKRMLRRFVDKVELGYKKANLWYTYPVDNNIPFRVYSVGASDSKSRSTDDVERFLSILRFDSKGKLGELPDLDLKLK